MLRHILVATSLLLALQAHAGELEDALAAQQRGQHEVALNLFRNLAQRGDATAQFRLSLMLAQGQGTKPDAAKALYWLKSAARAGSADARSNLGVAYGRGLQVPQDAVKAYALFGLAVDAGSRDAQTNMALLLQRMPLAQQQAAQQMLDRCRQRGVDACL